MQKIIILDFGSQYTQLIARRVREIGVFCEIFSCDVDPQLIINSHPRGIILSGGPETVTVDHSLRAPDCVFTLGCPVLGICYGMQTMALQLGGRVESSHKPEFGYAKVHVRDKKILFSEMEDVLDVWMSHGDHVTQLPSGFHAIADNESTPISAMADFSRQFYGLQFHPEVTHTPKGQALLEKFVLTICDCKVNWTPQSIIENSIESIRAEVGQDQALVGLSGGVDSAVVAALLHRAIGDQLTCVLVDTGLLRLHEAEQVITEFRDHLKVKLICVSAESMFMKALQGVSDPEQKRKIIGKCFIDVFEAEAKKLQGIRWLGQGTIYPDVIESAKTQSGKGHVIKSHHNVGGLPERMHLKLIEPLRELFKDEVRQLGLALGLPKKLVYRHPFPGPGLGVRILGEVTAEYVDILQRADAIFIEELRKHNFYDQVSQAFAVFIPVKSVAVKGDARHYGYVIGLRAVKTMDFMTAHWADLPHDFLATVSLRIVNEVKEVSRVVYDISGKPPATIEWE